jgi:hypothetical protein
MPRPVMPRRGSEELMRTELHRHLLWTVVLSAAALPLVGCESDDRPEPEYTYVCDRALSVAPVKADSRALIVTEPEALAKLQLEDVLAKLISAPDVGKTTPLEMMQRLFDTSNDEATAEYTDISHCDSQANPAHRNGPAAFCPRAEGALAKSTGFFSPGHPDHFYPVAVVNRMDLMSTFGSDCGQYRIVYAKESGLTDPNNRVFLILEAVLPMSVADSGGESVACQSVAQFWQNLDAAESDEAVGTQLQDFFFNGLPGRGPVLTPPNLGFGSLVGTGYYGTTGQIRMSQHINGEWEYREFHLGSALGATNFDAGPLAFIPSVVGNNPMPALFDVASENELSMQVTALRNSLNSSAYQLASRDLVKMTMTFTPDVLSGESVLGGPEVNDYAARAVGNDLLLDGLEETIEKGDLSQNCPTDDPITAESLLKRATVQSCAGCHAPAKFLGPEREIGCGMKWPDSLDPSHVDEKGNVSPALKDVFLPHRAEVLTRVLQACYTDDIYEGLAAPTGASAGAQTKSLRRGTIGGSVTH